MRYRVSGSVVCSVSIIVDADSKDEALEVAPNEFGGISNFCGNGGSDKLVGVCGSDESIEADGEPEFTDAAPEEE